MKKYVLEKARTSPMSKSLAWNIGTVPVGRYECASVLKGFFQLDWVKPFDDKKVRILNDGQFDLLGQHVGDRLSVKDVGAALLYKDMKSVNLWLDDPTRVNAQIAPSLAYIDSGAPDVSPFELPPLASAPCDFSTNIMQLCRQGAGSVPVVASSDIHKLLEAHKKRKHLSFVSPKKRKHLPFVSPKSSATGAARGGALVAPRQISSRCVAVGEALGRNPDHALRQHPSASMDTMKLPGFVLMRKIADGQEGFVDIEVLEVLIDYLFAFAWSAVSHKHVMRWVEERGCGPGVYMCVHAIMDVYVVRFGCEPVLQQCMQQTCKAGLIHLFG